MKQRAGNSQFASNCWSPLFNPNGIEPFSLSMNGAPVSAPARFKIRAIAPGLETGAPIDSG